MPAWGAKVAPRGTRSSVRGCRLLPRVFFGTWLRKRGHTSSPKDVQGDVGLSGTLPCWAGGGLVAQDIVHGGTCSMLLGLHRNQRRVNAKPRHNVINFDFRLLNRITSVTLWLPRSLPKHAPDSIALIFTGGEFKRQISKTQPVIGTRF